MTTTPTARTSRFAVRGDGEITEIPFYAPNVTKRFVCTTSVVTDTRKK